MRAGWRVVIAAMAAGLALVPAPLRAQNAEPQSANTPAADAIGPRELQNFSLEGTVTRQAEPSPAPRSTSTAPVRPPAAPPIAETRSAPPAPSTGGPPRRTEAARREQPDSATARPVAAAEAALPVQSPPASSVTLTLPPARPTAAPGQAVDPGFAQEGDADVASLAPAQSLPLWPWLLAALALGAGGAYLFWRRSGREAFAGGPRTDAFVAPQPAARPPAPRLAPPPPEAPAPAPAGIVSTRLRPWIDIDFQPTRCTVEQDRVSFEFEVLLTNSGNLPAQEVLIEAAMINAGRTQDEEIGMFFAQPLGRGDRIPVIEAHNRFSLTPKLVVPLDKVRMLDAGGRKVFVPLIAFNAVYRWNRSQGQTSAVYLVGRETAAEKLAPFRLDLGARIFRGLGARLLDLNLRS